MSVVQYVSDLVAGAFMFFVIAAYMTASAGVGTLGAVLFFGPLLLFGFISGLAFFLPRTSAVLALLVTLPFIYVGVLNLAYPAPASESWHFLLPGAVVAIISAIVLVRTRTSTWSGLSSRWIKCLVLIIALAPAVYMTYALISFFSSVTFHRNI